MSAITDALEKLTRDVRGAARRGANLAAFTSAGAASGQVPTADGKGGVRWAAASSSTSATPYVNLGIDGSVTLPNAAMTDVRWGYTHEAPPGYHSDTADPEQVTIPASMGGIYLIRTRLNCPGASAGEKSVIVKRNGDTAIDEQADPTATVLTCADTLRLNAGDKLTVSAWNATGAPMSVTWQQSALRITRLGA